MAGGDHRGQAEPRPAIAGRAVGVQLVVVLVQAGERSEVDHGVSVAPRQAQRMSRITSNSASPDELLRCIGA